MLLYVLFQDGAHTCHGELFSEAVRSVATSSQVLAVGINCTSPEYVEVSELSVIHCFCPIYSFLR